MKYNALTETKKLWIDTHINDYPSAKAIHKALCNIFPEAPSYQSVQFYVTAKYNPKYALSKEEENWLLQNLYNYTIEKQLTKGFNEHFNRNITHQIMVHHYNRLNISYQNVFTKEMIQWLKDQPEFITLKEHYRDFVKKFKKEIKHPISIQNFRCICYNYNIKYKKASRRLPLGSLVYCGDELYIKVKKEPENEQRKNETKTSYPKPWWMKVSEYLYTVYVRPLKDDESILYLDNNPNNLRIENLYAIPLNQLKSLSRNGFRSTNSELTKLGVLNTQLRYALRETEEAQ